MEQKKENLRCRFFRKRAVSAFIPSVFGSPKNVDRQKDITKPASIALCCRGWLVKTEVIRTGSRFIAQKKPRSLI